MARRPNILFFFTDDQRHDTIASLGNPVVRTPTIDSLVEGGLSFTHAHIPCGTSGAVCMPSRAMLHTGRTLFHIQGEGQSIARDHVMLGEALQRAGYRTFGTGKWHNGPESYTRSFTEGAEIFFGGMEDHWNVPAYDFDPRGRYDRTCPVVREPYTSKDVEERRCDHIHAGKHSSELFADASIDFLRSYDSDDPFFMYVSFMAPHDPRTMPRRFLEMYDPEEIELPRNFAGGHPFDNGALRIRDELLAGFPRDPHEIRRHIAEYFAMISHLDYEMGRVLQALRESGRADDTLVVFAGDNGLALGQHGLMGKQSCYDHSVRVPLVVAGPGVPAGVRNDAFVYLFDIYPTLCELTAVEAPPTVEGSSLTGCFGDSGWSPRESLYFAYTSTIRAVRDRTHKLIEYAVEGRRTTQLFDLEADPWERKNLAETPGAAGKRRDLNAEMRRYRDEWDDTEHPMGRTFWDQMER